MSGTFQKQIYDFLMESQYFPESDIRRHQVNQLEQLVRHARREVPFYRERLNVLFNIQDKFDFSRWQEVPILRRSDLLKHRHEMLAGRLPEGHGPVAEVEGSGTTGQAATTSFNGLIGYVSSALYYRGLNWHRIDYAKTRFIWFGGELDKYRGPDGLVGTGWGPSWDPHGSSGTYCQLSRVDPAELAVNLMIKHRASYATGKPNAMLELAVETERQKRKFNLEAIISFSAQLTGAVREECTRVFGARLIDRYASKEIHDMAHQCPECDGLHVSSEAMFFEVLDDRDRPCPPGKPGRVIVTPFYNTVQPFIRYELGDIVTLQDSCRCGRTLPLISLLIGRTQQLFQRADGSMFSLRLPDLLRRTIGARDWQVAQTGHETIEIRFVKIREAPQIAFEDIVQTVRSQMSPKTEVKFVPLPRLPETASGKVLEMVRELDNAGVPRHG